MPTQPALTPTLAPEQATTALLLLRQYAAGPLCPGCRKKIDPRGVHPDEHHPMCRLNRLLTAIDGGEAI